MPDESRETGDRLVNRPPNGECWSLESVRVLAIKGLSKSIERGSIMTFGTNDFRTLSEKWFRDSLPRGSEVSEVLVGRSSPALDCFVEVDMPFEIWNH
jgi:hypothetical protein